jgi:uncharacterized protein
MDRFEKQEQLMRDISETGGLVVAFSGGVDSSYLLKIAHEVLGDRVLAVTARSSTYPEREYREAVAFCRTYGIPHRTVVSEELDVEGFADNPPDRCYLCKRELFTKLAAVAREAGATKVAEGSNADDVSDYRPGLRAVAEQGVLSPLRTAGLTKSEIRELSKDLGLPTWDKPAYACLSSRFPYGERITPAKLAQVDGAEQFLLDLGFRQVRVRHHGDVARIELAPIEISRFVNEGHGTAVLKRFKELGFKYAALDVAGYRTGSMNDTLPTGA